MNVQTIINEVCREYELSPQIIQSQSRCREIVEPRQVAHYLAKQLTNKSLGTIGRMIGFKDHATVHSSCKTVSNLIETDDDFRDRVNRIRKRLNEIVSKQFKDTHDLNLYSDRKQIFAYN